MAYRTKAYSYARWSSARQGDGHSLERQLSAALEYAREHDLDLDPTMVDDAVSAYRGDNRLKGELSRFKSRIVDGEIREGSYLLIDSYDRFSREEATVSVQALLEIVNAGVNVVTLSNRAIFKKGAESAAQSLMFAVMDLDRAHKESLEKGRKVKKAHDALKQITREEGRPWTPVGPSWCSAIIDGLGKARTIRFEAIDERKKIIQQIFDLYENGVSSTAIARQLNDEKVLTHYKFWENSQSETLKGQPRKRKDSGQWSADTIFTTVTNRAVLGEYQPHILDKSAPRGRREDGPPISGVYPAIISEDQFLRVQVLIDARRAAPRRASPKAFRNLFIGLGRCAECRGTFSLHSNTNYDNRQRVPRLRCVAAQNGGACNNRLRLPYPSFEDAILRFVSEVKLPTTALDASPVRQELAEAILRRDDLDDRVHAAMLKAQVDKSDDRRERHYQALRLEFMEAEAVVKNLSKQEMAARSEKPVIEHQRALLELFEQMSLYPNDSVELYRIRAKLSESIRQIVDCIEFHKNGEVYIFLRGGMKTYIYVGGEKLLKIDLTGILPHRPRDAKNRFEIDPDVKAEMERLFGSAWRRGN
jgi:DNA invertase Pin-like site-specific DNA recombinase